MTSLLVFRGVVAASFLTCLAAVIYGLSAESGFSQEWQDLLAWNGNGGVIPDEFEELTLIGWVVTAALLMWLLVGLVNEVLFFCCWRYSRMIYLWTCVIGVGFTMFLGLSITTPVEETLLQASTFLSGVALGLAYCSPLAERFDRPRKVTAAASPGVEPSSGRSD